MKETLQYARAVFKKYGSLGLVALASNFPGLAIAVVLVSVLITGFSIFLVIFMVKTIFNKQDVFERFLLFIRALKGDKD